jgi:large subunit ribosomal protein L13
MDSNNSHVGMNKAYFLPVEHREPRWVLVDAAGQVLGRLATRIANSLRGKDKAIYTPHTDSGDYVIVINADKVVLTGNKWNDKIYERYTGYIGGLRETTAKELVKKHPTKLIEHAVKGMLPKNKLSDQILKKLKVYATPHHPHTAHKIQQLV